MTMHDEFEAFWAQEIANNGGVQIGADYKHWARKGWQAARKKEREACAVEAESWRRGKLLTTGILGASELRLCRTLSAGIAAAIREKGE